MICSLRGQPHMSRYGANEAPNVGVRTKVEKMLKE